MMADMLDIYGAQVNQFNFEGRTKVFSPTGLCCSMLTMVILIAYTVCCFVTIFSGYNPTLTYSETTNMYASQKNAYQLKKDGFKVGFLNAIETKEGNKWNTGEFKVKVFEGDGLSRRQVTEVNTHPCDEDDFE